MAALQAHEFHFVIGRKMKNALMDLEIFKRKGNLSGVITEIVSVLSPVIKREHEWGEERESRYDAVCEDPEEVREHVHVYFPRKVYREFKLMHQDLNVYSIAQLVRFFLEFFLGLVEVFGDSTISELRKIFRKWEKENKENRLTMREKQRQLLRILPHLCGQTGLVTIYCEKYSPFWILRL